MHKLYWLPLVLALTACSTLESALEDKEDETKEWSAEKLYSEAKDSLTDEYDLTPTFLEVKFGDANLAAWLVPLPPAQSGAGVV